jgi:cytochrome c553
MRKGEKGILVAIVLIVVLFAAINIYRQGQEKSPDKGIPFYSTATKELQDEGAHLTRKLECRNCHTLWGIRNAMQAVPAPSLDGTGSLRDEGWLYSYLSATEPQTIIPSRLKAEYKMPSYAHLSEEERRMLAAYLASLKVEDWYLPQVRKTEYEKLTGQDYKTERGGRADE